jgi:hypothetical protein
LQYTAAATKKVVKEDADLGVIPIEDQIHGRQQGHRFMTANPSAMSDYQLLHGFYACNTAAFDALAARYDKKLAGFLHFVVGDPDIAENLLNDVWTAVYLAKVRGRNRYNPSRGSVEGYLFALAGQQAHRWLTV